MSAEDRSGRPMWLLVAFVGVSGMFVGQFLSRPAPPAAPVAAAPTTAPPSAVTNTPPATPPTSVVVQRDLVKEFEALEAAEHQKELFRLTNALIQSISLAALAKDQLQIVTTQPPPDSAAIRVATILAKRQLLLAKAVIEPFAKTTDQEITQLVQPMTTSYDTLTEGMVSMLAAQEKLAAVRDEAGLLDVALEARESTAKLQQAWKVLPTAANALTHLLVNSERQENGKMCCLRISSDQRMELLRVIDRHFEHEDVRTGPRAGQHPTTYAVALLRQFVTSEWKSADAP